MVSLLCCQGWKYQVLGSILWRLRRRLWWRLRGRLGHSIGPCECSTDLNGTWWALSHWFALCWNKNSDRLGGSARGNQSQRLQECVKMPLYAIITKSLLPLFKEPKIQLTHTAATLCPVAISAVSNLAPTGCKSASLISSCPQAASDQVLGRRSCVSMHFCLPHGFASYLRHSTFNTQVWKRRAE